MGSASASIVSYVRLLRLTTETCRAVFVEKGKRLTANQRQHIVKTLCFGADSI